MIKSVWMLCGLCLAVSATRAQQIAMNECAPLVQVYGDASESDEPLPMNDIGVESGYVLYEAPIDLRGEEAVLELEHVRDYAAVYVDGAFQGTVTDSRKTLALRADAGVRTLRLYVENIGRITYGPEILDNSKGVFGSVSVDGESITDWKMTPLGVREGDPDALAFAPIFEFAGPCFRRGSFDLSAAGDVYLDVSGWGMGEVWINGSYLGSYWDEEKQQSIRIPSEILTQKSNRIVVFDITNNDPGAVMRLCDKPVFK